MKKPCRRPIVSILLALLLLALAAGCAPAHVGPEANGGETAVPVLVQPLTTPTATPAPTPTPGPGPATGDAANPLPWLVGAAVMAAAIAALLVLRRRAAKRG